jgi:ADP-ribose pyrophosphatase
MSKRVSNTIWQGRSWRLCTTVRTLPGGDQMEVAYIDHPGAIVVVPWLENGARSQILMLHQFRPALGKSILELPAGTRESREAWEACAQRELREETGYGAEQLISLGRCWPAPGVSNESMLIYLASGLHHDPLPQDEDEEIEVVPYDFAELLSMALDGRLEDAKSVVGILRTAYFKRLL